ncbi:hypothetical protein DNTS_022628 [Danionella cerebrum]|uniref:Uncharacterized protein n=1 Tax=Danionella cerebrum TaxID=2873325 RepID=A0A553QE77_9TELE|nr:hypothetical protein DNTS_022628 [Danionella translucida]
MATPGVLDQICKFFGGDKKKKPKRPQRPSTRRPVAVNPVVQFFRSFASSPRPKSRASPSVRATESIRSPRRRRREQNTLSRIFNLNGQTFSFLYRLSIVPLLGHVFWVQYPSREKADLARLPNAGAPSSEPFCEQNTTRMEPDKMPELEREDSQANESLTH